jgi:hypothetical protein
MSRERELLKRALAVLGQARLADIDDWLLFDEIRAELQKPEPVECGYVRFRHGSPYADFDFLDDGKYRLLAERINNE